MTPSSNGIHRPPYGGPPMVRIDGALVRSMREEQGLTQLYLATAVGVTTDTISRWENRKYPSVKKENALKLAETLGVDIEEILEKQVGEENQPQDTETVDERDHATVSGQAEWQEPAQAPRPQGVSDLPAPGLFARHWKMLLLAATSLVAAGAMGMWYWQVPVEKDITVTAVRNLPGHAPPGATFPVIISLSSSSKEKISLILSEHFPDETDIIKAVPPWSAASPDRKEIKWIVSTSSHDFTICYMAKISADAKKGSPLVFVGEVTSSLTGRHVFPVKGSNVMTVQPFHWADLNSDGQIDDEEILRVFDELGERKGLAFGLDEIKTIWSSGGYIWNSKTHKYIPVKQERNNEYEDR